MAERKEDELGRDFKGFNERGVGAYASKQVREWFARKAETGDHAVQKRGNRAIIAYPRFRNRGNFRNAITMMGHSPEMLVPAYSCSRRILLAALSK
jgi:hypothetical protein